MNLGMLPIKKLPKVARVVIKLESFQSDPLIRIIKTVQGKHHFYVSHCQIDYMYTVLTYSSKMLIDKEQRVITMLCSCAPLPLYLFSFFVSQNGNVLFIIHRSLSRRQFACEEDITSCSDLRF